MATIGVVIDVAQEWLLLEHGLDCISHGLQAPVWHSAWAEGARLASLVRLSEFGEVLDNRLYQANQLSAQCAPFRADPVVVIAHRGPLAQRGLRLPHQDHTSRWFRTGRNPRAP